MPSRRRMAKTSLIIGPPLLAGRSVCSVGRFNGFMSWLDSPELRVGLGCMRLPADERLALDTILAAADAGVTVFDTAHAYGADRSGLGDGERLVARGLRAAGSHVGTRIVTKGGMTRHAGAWVPDGRAKAIAA